MGQVFKTSRSSIRAGNVNDRFVYLLESENPEIRLAKTLRDFLAVVGFSSIFPNFNNIRVGTVHPFAILLAQDVLGEKQTVNIFPSITIVDSTMQEDAEVLGDEYISAMFSRERIAELDGYRQAKRVFVSDEGWEKVNSYLSENEEIFGVTRQYHTQHTIDFNIWSGNKEVTSFLFDSVCHFVTQTRDELHLRYGLDMAGIQGRRSGDINLDFGKILYGANVSMGMSFNQRATMFDVSVVDITSIDTQTLPQYFTLGAVHNGETSNE